MAIVWRCSMQYALKHMPVHNMSYRNLYLTAIPCLCIYIITFVECSDIMNNLMSIGFSTKLLTSSACLSMYMYLPLLVLRKCMVPVFLRAQTWCSHKGYLLYHGALFYLSLPQNLLTVSANMKTVVYRYSYDSPVQKHTLYAKILSYNFATFVRQ